MTECNFEVIDENIEIVTFQCFSCNAVVSFVKPGFGTPEAILTETGWIAPEGASEFVKDLCVAS